MLLAQFLPHLAPLDQVIGLLPKVDLGQPAVVPPVADDAVLRGRQAGQVSGLRRAGDGRERGDNSGLRAFSGKPGDARQVLPEQPTSEADDIEHRGPFHYSSNLVENLDVQRCSVQWRGSLFGVGR